MKGTELVLKALVDNGVKYIFGYTGGATIGDMVWFDRDGDGVFGAGEYGIGYHENFTFTWSEEDRYWQSDSTYDICMACGMTASAAASSTIAMFSEAFGEAYRHIRVGERITIGPPN